MLFLLFQCSRWSFVDVPLILSRLANHVPDRQPRILLGMVEALSVDVDAKYTDESKMFCTDAKWTETCVASRHVVKKNLNAPRLSEHPPVRGKECQNV